VIVVVFVSAGMVDVSMPVVVAVSVLVVVDVVVAVVLVGALVVGSVVVGGASARALAAAAPLPKTTTVASISTSLFETMTPDYQRVRSRRARRLMKRSRMGRSPAQSASPEKARAAEASCGFPAANLH
jgi:hypothetical protein